MSAGSDDEEVRALWTEMFGGPAPSAKADVLLRDIVDRAPVLDYERFTYAALGDKDMTWPTRAGRQR